MIFYYCLKTNNYSLFNCYVLNYSLKYIQPYFKLKKIFPKKPFFDLKAYLSLLVKIVLFLKQKKTRLNLLNSNWRFNFLHFNQYYFKVTVRHFKKVDLDLKLDKAINYVSKFDKFNKFFRKKLLVTLKKKLFSKKIFFFKKKVLQLKKKFNKSIKNLRQYMFFRRKKLMYLLKFNIQIKITKNNVFLVLQNLNENQTAFFISAGRIFKGKKKKNYLSSRFLTKTFIRLLIRFLLFFRRHHPSKLIKFLFSVSFNKSLTFFLVKSILNTFRYHKFPIYCIKNNYTTPHSFGVKQKKMRRL